MLNLYSYMTTILLYASSFIIELTPSSSFIIFIILEDKFS